MTDHSSIPSAITSDSSTRKLDAGAKTLSAPTPPPLHRRRMLPLSGTSSHKGYFRRRDYSRAGHPTMSDKIRYDVHPPAGELHLHEPGYDIYSETTRTESHHRFQYGYHHQYARYQGNRAESRNFFRSSPPHVQSRSAWFDGPYSSGFVEHARTSGCTCKKSKCLKLYCQCFSTSTMCGSRCRCTSCKNNVDYEQEIRDARHAIRERNPRAFRNSTDMRSDYIPTPSYRPPFYASPPHSSVRHRAAHFEEAKKLAIVSPPVSRSTNDAAFLESFSNAPVSFPKERPLSQGLPSRNHRCDSVRHLRCSLSSEDASTDDESHNEGTDRMSVIAAAMAMTELLGGSSTRHTEASSPVASIISEQSSSDEDDPRENAKRKMEEKHNYMLERGHYKRPRTGFSFPPHRYQRLCAPTGWWPAAENRVKPTKYPGYGSTSRVNVDRKTCNVDGRCDPEVKKCPSLSVYEQTTKTSGLPKVLSFRKICSSCGRTRAEHGDVGFGNKCTFQDCARCGAKADVHAKCSTPMGVLCSLKVEEGATPGKSEQYEKRITLLASRAEYQKTVNKDKLERARRLAEAFPNVY